MTKVRNITKVDKEVADKRWLQQFYTFSVMDGNTISINEHYLKYFLLEY